MLEKPNKSNEPEIFDQDIRQFVKEFKECVAKSGEDVCTTRKTWFELTGGLYYFSVKRWLDLFPRESFMFIHLSDFTDPTTFHKKIKGNKTMKIRKCLPNTRGARVPWDQSGELRSSHAKYSFRSSQDA